METFNFDKHKLFINQHNALARMKKWYEDETEQKLFTLYGRRRIGKTWLFKEFAHEKLAVILVASKQNQKEQFKNFEEELSRYLPTTPRIESLDELFKVIYKLGGPQKVLVVIDEFPYLLRQSKNYKEIDLTEIQAALEKYRDNSNNKVILCGSFVSQMEALFNSEEAPLYGRLRPFLMRPLSFSQAQSFDKHQLSDRNKITRYSISGGLTKYIVDLNKDKDLKEYLISEVFDKDGELFEDPEAVLNKELSNPSNYLRILEHLSFPKTTEQLLQKTEIDKSNLLNYYLKELENLKIITSSSPAGAKSNSRKTKYYIDDGFFRFWFRFVYPFKEQFEKGLDPEEHYQKNVEPALEHFTSFYYEKLCREFCFKEYADLCPNGNESWWGPSLKRLRVRGERIEDEIDIVCRKNKTLTMVGECKWTKDPMGTKILDDLLKFKIPALQEEIREGRNLFKPGADPQIILFSKSGFKESLTKRTDKESIILVDTSLLLKSIL